MLAGVLPVDCVCFHQPPRFSMSAVQSGQAASERFAEDWESTASSKYLRRVSGGTMSESQTSICSECEYELPIYLDMSV